MIIVNGRGGLSRVGAGDAPGVLDEAAFERDWCGEEQGVEGGAVEALADVGAGADEQQRGTAGYTRCDRFDDSLAFTSFHAAAQDDDVLAARGGEMFGECVDVVDPGGEDENVRASLMGVEYVCDDLFQALFVGDECAVDFSDSTGLARVGVAVVGEPGWVHVEYPVGRGCVAAGWQVVGCGCVDGVGV